MMTIGNNYNKAAMDKDYIYVQPGKMNDYLADKCRKVDACIFFQYNGITYSVWAVTEGKKKFFVTDSCVLAKHLDDNQGRREYTLRSVCVHNERFTTDHQVRCF